MGAEHQKGYGRTSQNAGRYPTERTGQLFDLASRGLIGQLVNPPETPIGVPLQQAVSNLQGGFPTLMSNFGLGGGLADRLGGGPPPTAAGAAPGSGAGSLLPTSISGLGQQFGLQSREQLGIPPRESQFSFLPNADEIAKIGLAPVRGGTKQLDKLQRRETKLEGRQAKATASGNEGKAAKAGRKIDKVQAKRKSLTSTY